MNQPFSENDIRPDTLIAGQQKAIEKDIAHLLKQKDAFVAVPCPACTATEYESAFEKNGFHYVHCRTCETLYVNPRPTPEIIEDFLKHSENYAYWSTHIFPVSEVVRREKIFKPRVDRLIALCKKHTIATDALLEVGAGYGIFAEELSTRGVFKRIVAVEPSNVLASHCRARGIEVIEATIENVDPKKHESFDIVVNFEVIEHLFSPREFLLQCRAFLKPGGLFMVTCPNGKGFDITVLGKLSGTVDHEHLNYFNPASLALLLESCGFKVIESLTPGTLDVELVRKKILDGTFDASGQPFLKQVLIDGWEEHGIAFQQFLQDQRLSSNMWLIAKRT